ncbi:MAG: NAD(P)-dependent oxidoreductase [Burkholderiales bacterium]|nr:NAD(P)-dependent oxidoreductase [Burkholderiales bacterium]
MAAGFHVAGYDLRAEAREALAAQGVQAAATLAGVAAAAGCVVLGVVEGADGLLPVPGVRHIIDCSTGTPDAHETLAARLKKRGVDFIEAPLSRIIEQCAERGIRASAPGAIRSRPSACPGRWRVGPPTRNWAAHAPRCTTASLGYARAGRAIC